MKLSVVFPLEIGITDQRGLKQPDEEDAGAGERVEDMNAVPSINSSSSCRKCVRSRKLESWRRSRDSRRPADAALALR